MSEVKATYTKDIHYSGIITVDGETVVSAALAGIALILIIVGQTLINRFTKKAGA